jgi:uncharacterized protein involved in exopolysaccharide biosynthesis
MEAAHAVLAAGWRRRRIIAVPMVMLPVLGYGISLTAPQTFEAKMSLIVEDLRRVSPTTEDMEVASMLKDRMEALKAVLGSRRVLLGVAEDIGLLKPNAPREAQDDVVWALSQAVRVDLIGSDLLQFTYRAPYAKGMAVTLNRISARFMERVMGPEETSARDSAEFLKRQLDEAEKSLAATENSLGGFRARNVQQLPEQRNASVARLATLRESLGDHEIRLAGAQSEFVGLRARLVQTDPVIGRLEQDIVAATSELANLRARYTGEHSSVQAAERKLSRLEETRLGILRGGDPAQPATVAAVDSAPAAPAQAGSAQATAADGAAPAHPAVAATEPGGQVSQADMDRLWNMAASTPAGHTADGESATPLLVSQVATLQAAKGRIDQILAETNNLRAVIADIEKRLSSSGDVERQMHELEHELLTRTEAVADLHKRYEKARVANDLTRYQAPERVKVVDQPIDPLYPMRPYRLLFTAGGLLGGIAFGFGIAAIGEMADPAVRRMRDMERISGVSVLARIPPINA